MERIETRPPGRAAEMLALFKRRPWLIPTISAVLCAGLTVATSWSQTPGKVDAEVAELAVRLIGAPVLAEGKEVGKLADISITDEGRVDKIRISTGAKLGFGTRIVEIRAGSFKIRRNAVVLDIPPDVLDALPTADALPDVREDK
jgi:hypothetical protein